MYISVKSVIGIYIVPSLFSKECPIDFCAPLTFIVVPSNGNTTVFVFEVVITLLFASSINKYSSKKFCISAVDKYIVLSSIIILDFTFLVILLLFITKLVTSANSSLA